MTTVKRTICHVAGAAAVAATCGVLLVLAPGQAFAAAQPALRTSLTTPTPVAPGGTGTVTYRVTNQSPAATEGVLINISLPKFVTINPDEQHCQKTGTNPEGGDLISCNMSDNLGKLTPGQTNTDNQKFTIAQDAPHHAKLGQLTTLAVPLKNGQPTEDWHKFGGSNASSTVIATS